MAPLALDRLPVGPDWCYQPKWDGVRCTARRAGRAVRLRSRHMRPLTAAFPEVVAALAQLDEDVCLDGELVVVRGARCDFAALLDRLRAGPARAAALEVTVPAVYVVFDMLGLGGFDLRGQPLHARRRALETLLTGRLPPALALTPSTEDVAAAEAWMAASVDVGIEGVVAKRVQSRYRPGQAHGGAWRKVKTRITTHAVVGGVTGSVAAPDTLVLGRPTAGQLRIAGRTVRLPARARTEVGPLLHPEEHSWPPVLPAHRWGSPPIAYQRVRPEVVVEVSAEAAETEQRWRHPVRYIALRADLHPMDLLG